MATPVLPPSPPRSTFITALAWTFIVMAGFASLIAVAQNIMIQLMFPTDLALPPSPHASGVPAVLDFLLGHIRYLFLAFLILSIGTLVAAIGLLKRRNWARLAFVGILGLGILWNLAGIALQQLVFASPGLAQTDGPLELERMFMSCGCFPPCSPWGCPCSWLGSSNACSPPPSGPSSEASHKPAAHHGIPEYRGPPLRSRTRRDGEPAGRPRNPPLRA